ncbi:MAG TPA: error-prone DNA polymerase [Planctomycetota bacterium]|nr:error-prone DNA polymerase [Planctomycetota bacterium]
MHAVSNFTFLRGASHPDELVETAKAYGYAALALTDRASVAGVVRAHVKAKELGFRFLVGAEVALRDAATVVLLPVDRAAYGRLCRLLTTGRRRAEKGKCDLGADDLEGFSEGLIALAIPDEEALRPDADAAALEASAARLRPIAQRFGADAFLAFELFDGPDDRARAARLERLAAATGLTPVAAGGVEAHVPERRLARDVLRAVELKTTVARLGSELPQDGVRALVEPAVLLRRYAGREELLARTVEIAARCRFSLDELRYEYPLEGGAARLRRLVERGARERWPDGVPEKARKLVEYELALISDLKYEAYFLTVYEIVAFARSRGILCQGRGSAANSAVCYCLGVTSVDPDRFDVLFERFVSRDRDEPPDIDVDFEHERREEVLQHLYGKYGRERAALAATVITYRGRSAVRDVGKALGLALDQVDRLSAALQWWEESEWPEQRLVEAGFDPDDAVLRRVLALTREIHGFPRHLSQHVGGMVLTRGRLDELVPVENAAMEGRTVIEWDKDDLDALGLLKVDCLCLGMLTAIRKAFDLLAATRGAAWTLATIPAEDPATYAMIRRADTVGVFQIESRAQMAMLPRLRPERFYDLVIEVAIVRPGPIQGGMVHPYLRRREGAEDVTFPSKEVEAVLSKTLGVPIFQEQAMKLAVVAAGFTPGEADQLRRAMGAWRRPGILQSFEKKLVEGMTARGYEGAFAEALYKQISGFGEYGFPESHAASFALLTYVSCWLKRHEPAAFLAALLNSQPLGFYAPAQLVYDARAHGVPVRPVDATRSAWDATLETDGLPPLRPGDASPDARPTTYGHGGPAVRLGLRQVKGFSRAAADRLLAARRERPFASTEDCRRRARLNRREASLLAEAGAFAALAEHRRDAWWDAALDADDAPLFRDAPLIDATRPALPPPAPADLVASDYRATELSLVAHPARFLRERLGAVGAATCADYAKLPHGSFAAVGGVVVTRQRPATASGIVFMTLEDETGICNVVVRVREQKRHRSTVLEARLLLVRGRVERHGEVVHLVAADLADLTQLLAAVPTASRDFH